MRLTLFSLCFCCWSAISARPTVATTSIGLLTARYLHPRAEDEPSGKQKADKKDDDEDDDHGGMPSGILFFSIILVLLACMVSCIVLTCCLVRLCKKVKLLEDELGSRSGSGLPSESAKIASEYRASMFVQNDQRPSVMNEHTGIPNTPMIMDEELRQAQHEPASNAPLYNQPMVSGHFLPYNISEISVSDIDLAPSLLKRSA